MFSASTLNDKLFNKEARKPMMVRIIGKLDTSNDIALPYYPITVPAGFPSPADDYIQERITVSEVMQYNETSTYIVQATGDSMIEAGIQDKSFLVVDKSRMARHNDIVIVSINNNYTVKRLKKHVDGALTLCPENPNYQPIVLTENLENILWGVVISVIKVF